MSILVDENTYVLVQGITGKEGSFHGKLCRDYGTKIAAGVTPGKGGSFLEGIPVFNSVREAKKYDKRINASIIFVPAPYAALAILEAVESELDLVVCITDGIPVHDMMMVKNCLAKTKTKLLGPNCPGLISPTKMVKLGIIPARVCRPGKIGVISRSGTLTYEISAQLSKKGFGQSICLGIGGDPIVGLNFVDCLRLFEKDIETEAVVMIGEIGGSSEEEAAEFIKKNFKKPVVSYICGLTAPLEKRMGHAGAIISGGRGGAIEKIEALEAAGVEVARDFNEISSKLNQILKRA